jgi:hypothetical protein
MSAKDSITPQSLSFLKNKIRAILNKKGNWFVDFEEIF